MATRIDEIFAALAAIDVTFDAQVVTTYNVDALPESVDNRHTPCRLLLPLGTRAEARSITPVVVSGKVASIQWRITDLFLMKPTGLTGGIAVEAPKLLAYMKAHFDAIQEANFRLTRHALIENLTYEPTITPFPTAGKTEYFAVEVGVFPKETAS